MKTDAEVYDLGDLGIDNGPRRPRASQTMGLVSSPPREPRPAPSPPSWPVGLALFVPGGGHLTRGRIASGLAFLASVGLVAALTWAILGSLDRLGSTLALLELPPESAVWALGALYIVVAAIHVASVVGATPRRPVGRPVTPPHPVLAGVASFLVPGWGQALSGHRWSAALFLSGCWLAVGTWILVSPPVQALLDAQNLYLPRGLALLGSAPVRWTLPVVLWALAVYDAAFRAARARA